MNKWFLGHSRHVRYTLFAIPSNMVKISLSENPLRYVESIQATYKFENCSLDRIKIQFFKNSETVDGIFIHF
jgi:hypothetical protein